MKPGGRSKSTPGNNNCTSLVSLNNQYYTVKISCSLWTPPVSLQQLIPQYLQYCRVTKVQDVLWQLSVGLIVPDTPTYVRTLLNLPESASIAKSDLHQEYTIEQVLPPTHCTLCHNVGASKIEWSIKSKVHRKEFFGLLTKSMGIGSSEEFKFYESDEDVIEVCNSCTAQLQTLSSLFLQLKKVEESFKNEAGKMRESIVRGIGPQSQKSWSFLRERVVAEYIKSTNTDVPNSSEMLGELINPSGCPSTGSYDPMDQFDVADNENSLGETAETKFFIDMNDSDQSDGSEEEESNKEDKKEKRLKKKRSSEERSRNRKGGRTKHEIWVYFKELMEGRYKVAECLKCRKSYKCPQADRLVKHVEQCSGVQRKKSGSKRKRNDIKLSLTAGDETIEETDQNLTQVADADKLD